MSSIDKKLMHLRSIQMVQSNCMHVTSLSSIKAAWNIFLVVQSKGIDFSTIEAPRFSKLENQELRNPITY